MKILSIETSCDETAVSIVEATGGLEKPGFTVLSNLVLSQMKIHEQYGGVFPNIAKREHSKNLGRLIKTALQEAGLLVEQKNSLTESQKEKIIADLSREPELCTALIELFESSGKPAIDLIAVTFGPGLEPALWVGINAGKVLSEVWGIPVMPINHMEGHISSVLLDTKKPVEFPALALLISGGHTELVLVPDWLSYKIIGQTRDDAVGEAFDKVARMMGLPYPGGPQISALAHEAREAQSDIQNDAEKKSEKKPVQNFNFPRPMIHSADYDFSFSGLKTSVLYKIRELKETLKESQSGVGGLSVETKKALALAFEDAVVETLLTKTKKAITEFSPKTLILAGGVIANKTIRKAFQNLTDEQTASGTSIQLLIPTHELATDNALMIAFAAYVRFSKNYNAENSANATQPIVAQGNVQLS